ncbi:hypothetical protein FRC09_008649 [Ceratobasidium sp. 395]|nr:hypothetical protein FRC09_008649 [Ceratobasidium sp. 395]
MAEQSTTPKRPDLRILIPGAPPARRAHRGQNDVAGQHKSTAAAPKDRSSCIVIFTVPFAKPFLA